MFTAFGDSVSFLGAYWIFVAIFCGVAAVMCCIGFKKFVWFLSVGYGLSVLGLGVSYAVTGFVTKSWDIIALIQCVLLVIYGFRLSGFLLIREIKNASYRKVLKSATKEDEKPMPFFVKFVIWVMCAFLYVMQTTPVFARMFNAGYAYLDSNYNAISYTTLGYPFAYSYGLEATWTAYVFPIIGIVISACGIIIEAIADRQKSAQKKENPHMVATKGLYKHLRCPNYFGEILFWTGMFIGGITAMKTAGQWILSSIGWICIVYIMINGAQRLDKRQEKNYGTSEEYRAYADHTPLIFPLIPVSHIGIYKVEDVEAAAARKAAKKAEKAAKKENK